MDFINLQIMNSSPFEYTYEKDGVKSSIDITLCSESISRWCNHFPITFNIKAHWSSPEIKKQKIETWNLRSDKWDLYRQILGKKLEEWRNNTIWWDQNNQQLLDFAVESWTNCVVESAKQSIGTRIIWKENKSWCSDSLSFNDSILLIKYSFYFRFVFSIRPFQSMDLFSFSVREHKEIVFSIQVNEFEQSFNNSHISRTSNWTDQEKAELLVSWFSQPPQPPSYFEDTKEHYQTVEDEITS
ncbi:hypothetical protein RFI_29383, partial [Reticulomyxa filosa]